MACRAPIRVETAPYPLAPFPSGVSEQGVSEEGASEQGASHGDLIGSREDYKIA